MVLGINYSSAKTIMRTYKEKGRIFKKLTRDRKRCFTRQKWHLRGQGAGSNEPQQKMSQPTRNDTLDLAIDSKFDFGVYHEKIISSFMTRYTRRLKAFEKMSATLALPVPGNFWTLVQERGRTLCAFKSKCLSGSSRSSSKEYT